LPPSFSYPFTISYRQCPFKGGYINEDGCPIDRDGDGVKDCVSVEPPAAITWPLTVTACHSSSPLAPSCCIVEIDTCDGTSKFATVDATGCPKDTDNDGVNDGKDRCPYTTKVESDYAKNLDPEGNAVGTSNLIKTDTFGCVVMADKVWEPTFVGVTTGNDSTDNDSGANPDLQVLFATNTILSKVQESRGAVMPDDLFKVRVMDYKCQDAYDDTTSGSTKLLPTKITLGTTGLFKGNIPEATESVMIDIELNPDDVIGSEIWASEPPYETGQIKFCLRLDLFSDTMGKLSFPFAAPSSFECMFDMQLSITSKSWSLPSSALTHSNATILCRIHELY